MTCDKVIRFGELADADAKVLGGRRETGLIFEGDRGHDVPGDASPTF